MSLLAAHFAVVPNDSKPAITLLATGDFSKLDLAVTGFVPPTAEEKQAAEEAATQLTRLNQASTEEGLRVLKADLGSLRRIQQNMNSFVTLCTKVIPEDYRRLVAELRAKKAAQQAIAQDILPNGVTVDRFKAFLDSTEGIFAFPGNEGDPCPFCRRPLDDESVRLVTKYHSFLVNALQQQVSGLAVQVVEAAGILESVRDFSFVIDEATVPLLEAGKHEEIIKCIGGMKGAIPTPLSRDNEPTFGAFDHQPALRSLLKYVTDEADKRDAAIKAATSNREIQQKELSQLTAQCNQYAYRHLVNEQLASLKAVLAKYKSRHAMKELVNITDFPTILRRMTNAGKEAHTELVVAEFEKMLDREYKALSGKGLTDFGIRLVPRGQQQEVAIEAHIGNTPIRRILSEGEQKIHALAMFFCEATARPCDVFVFDDPSTSFDYNNLAHFVERLRDLALNCPKSQFVLFTHNWDFFVHVQLSFNKARLNNDMSVQVLEHCAIVEAYSEKVEELKTEIEGMLGTSGDFDTSQKERISGVMRRLVESLVNKHVFNGQRHQFKQRAQSVCVFDECIKLVPLLPAEAQKLSDLYSHLSVSEHDDPRNLYVSRNKASFQKWYGELAAVESAIIARRP